MSAEKIEILNSDRLLRKAWFTNPSYVREDMTVTSFAFKLRKDETGLSVDIERLTTYDKSIGDIERNRLFVVTAEVVRSIGLECEHMPLADNYAHAEILNISKNSHSSFLAKNAKYVYFPV